MVAGEHDQLLVGPERARRLSAKNGAATVDRVAVRGLAQLEAVAEDHEPVDAVERLQQRLPQVRRGAAGRCARAGRGAGRRRRGSRTRALVCPAMPPLDGILVADFSRVLAGPLAAMLLGDLGADVIKVERPDGGDDTRAWGPPWRDGVSDLLPRPQPQQALDRARPQGPGATCALARELAERADVLIESFRPGLIGELGPRRRTTLRARQPGPGLLLGDRVRQRRARPPALPGYDFLLQAMGGLMSVTGEPDGRPLKAGTAVVDLVCGLLAANGIQAALVERARTGVGRHVEVSLMDSALTVPAEPGHGVGGGGRDRAAGAATATRASSPTRPTRPPTGRSRSRSATSASSCGCARRSACPSCRATSASPPTRRGWSTPTSSLEAFEAVLRDAARRALARRVLREAKVPAGPDQRGRRGVRARRRSWAWSRSRTSTALPLIRPPLRVDGERPPIRHAPAAPRRARRRAARLAHTGCTWVMTLPLVQQRVHQHRRRLARPAPCRRRVEVQRGLDVRRRAGDDAAAAERGGRRRGARGRRRRARPAGARASSSPSAARSCRRQADLVQPRQARSRSAGGAWRRSSASRGRRELLRQPLDVERAVVAAGMRGVAHDDAHARRPRPTYCVALGEAGRGCPPGGEIGHRQRREQLASRARARAGSPGVGDVAGEQHGVGRGLSASDALRRPRASAGWESSSSSRMWGSLSWAIRVGVTRRTTSNSG